MLRDEVEKYTNLTGENGWHVPIMKVGAYLDGYNKGLEVLDEAKEEIEKYWRYCDENLQAPTLSSIKQIIDKYKTESEG